MLGQLRHGAGGAQGVTRATGRRWPDLARAMGHSGLGEGQGQTPSQERTEFRAGGTEVNHHAAYRQVRMTICVFTFFNKLPTSKNQDISLTRKLPFSATLKKSATLAMLGTCPCSRDGRKLSSGRPRCGPAGMQTSVFPAHCFYLGLVLCSHCCRLFTAVLWPLPSHAPTCPRLSPARHPSVAPTACGRKPTLLGPELRGPSQWALLSPPPPLPSLPSQLFYCPFPIPGPLLFFY